MLESLAAWRTSTVLVYMPVAEVNQIHPEVAAAATRTGAVLLDHRLVPGLGPEDFKDWSHLNEGGARKFSAVLGTSLATVLNSRDGRPRRP
jgi:hypothetical protein